MKGFGIERHGGADDIIIFVVVVADAVWFVQLRVERVVKKYLVRQVKAC